MYELICLLLLLNKITYTSCVQTRRELNFVKQVSFLDIDKCPRIVGFNSMYDTRL